jgi:hypothetical protein
MLGTIEKNYLRRGARWYLKKQEDDEEEVQEDSFSLDFSPETVEKKTKAKKRKSLDKYLDENGLTLDEYWEEVSKDGKSRSISQVLNQNGWLYTSYSELLETHRLASYPNVSAIAKGEDKDMKKLLGEGPPHSIRHMFEPHHTPVDTTQIVTSLKKGMDLITYKRSAHDREWYYIESDWSTGEVWYLAVISDDPNGIAIMSDPSRDIHSSVARNMCPYIPNDMSDLDVKEKFKAERDAAKPFVFGIPYGRGAGALVRQLNMEAVASGHEAKYTQADGEAFIVAYQQTMPRGWEYLEEQKARVESPGYLVSPWGFRRRFPRNLTGKEQISAFKREASNWQIQHGIACVKMEACKAFLDIKQQHRKMPFFLCDILHDATKYVVHGSVINEALEMVEHVMDTGLHLPFEAKAKLRHSVDLQVRWCGEKVDLASISAKQPSWEEVCRLVPTAPYVDILESSLRKAQITPHR